MGEIAGLCPAPRQGNDSPAPPFRSALLGLVFGRGALVWGGVFLCGPGVEGEIEGGLQGLVSCLGWGMIPLGPLVSRRVLTDALRLRLPHLRRGKVGNMVF